MSAEERRTMIATSAIPLYLEQGASVTSRQLADHLGIAEGTIFRVFGDKAALVRSVVDAFFDQTHQGLGPELEDPDLDVEQKLRVLIRNARARARGVFTMISLLEPGEAHEYMKHRREGHFEQTAAAAFAADAAQLNIPPQKLGALIRLLVIAASAPRMGGGDPLSDDELVDFALHGIIGQAGKD
ncbi:MAG: TetR/AcrR family transcriptional regulator [Micrococcaceae bacterium]|nr:TetR/AcrR family transcriptional regulator [Micrococcaceae bacterium]MDN5880530.1 TetR/AcrR family transcriptional regulator [Micrococcaceae bacterium]MDN6170720.1 TetR/AcrR family transcriptional regulator [Micrococcaceae bacterium]